MNIPEKMSAGSEDGHVRLVFTLVAVEAEKSVADGLFLHV